MSSAASRDDCTSEQHKMPMQNDLQQSEAVAEAARHDREAAMAQASQAQNHLDQLSSTVQQLVQRNEQAAKVSPSPSALVSGCVITEHCAAQTGASTDAPALLKPCVGLAKF